MLTTECPICHSPSLLVVRLSAAKSCSSLYNIKSHGSSDLASYYKCTVCNFLRTDYFDQWSNDDFAQRIYNDEYHLVDGDYSGNRAKGIVNYYQHIFRDVLGKEGQAILDYGSGSGAFVNFMKEQGYKSIRGYDPFSNPDAQFDRKANDVVTCWEVIEHERDPHLIFGTLLDAVQDEGLVVISTLLIGDKPAEVIYGHWYAAPRNAHLSLYSVGAFAYLCGKHGLSLKTDGQGKVVCSRRDLTLPDLYGPQDLSGEPYRRAISIVPEGHNYWLENDRDRKFIWFDASPITTYYIYSEDPDVSAKVGAKVNVRMDLLLPLSVVGTKEARITIADNSQVLFTTTVAKEGWTTVEFVADVPSVDGVLFQPFRLSIETVEGRLFSALAGDRILSYAVANLQGRVIAIRDL